MMWNVRAHHTRTRSVSNNEFVSMATSAQSLNLHPQTQCIGLECMHQYTVTSTASLKNLSDGKTRNSQTQSLFHTHSSQIFQIHRKFKF